jgi:hypothetical protein
MAIRVFRSRYPSFHRAARSLCQDVRIISSSMNYYVCYLEPDMKEQDAMQKNVSLRFISSDDSTLTISRTVGKSGIHVRASLKAKGDKKASTGCRSTHNSEAEANAAMESLRITTLQRGWTEQKNPQRQRNAFMEIPQATVTKAVVKK